MNLYAYHATDLCRYILLLLFMLTSFEYVFAVASIKSEYLHFDSEVNYMREEVNYSKPKHPERTLLPAKTSVRNSSAFFLNNNTKPVAIYTKKDNASPVDIAPKRRLDITVENHQHREIAKPSRVHFSDNRTGHSNVISLSEVLVQNSDTSLLQMKAKSLKLKRNKDIKNSKRVARRVTFAQAAVKGKKCCAIDHYLDSDTCIERTKAAPFSPENDIRIDLSEQFQTLSWETEMLRCPEQYKHQNLNIVENSVRLKGNATEVVLQWSELESNKITADYCIDQELDGSYFAVICRLDEKEVCSRSTCVRKCCGEGEYMSDYGCKRDPRNLLNLTFHSLSGDLAAAPDDLKLVSLGLDCPHTNTTSILFEHAENYPALLSNGKLYFKGIGEILDNSHFCVDFYTFDGAGEQYVEFCFIPRSSVQEWKATLTPYFLIISVIFLTTLIIFHLVVKELRNNIQGFCFLSYTVSLLMAYTGFFANVVFAKRMSYSQCIFNALFSQFVLLSAFFWLCVMAFDIWRVIRATVQAIPLTGITANDKFNFLLYSIFAFGCPLIISLISTIMQLLPSESTSGMVVPGFGKESCWFPDEMAQFVYFYLYIGLLNGISLVLLGHVIFMLVMADQGFSCFFKKRTNSRSFNRKHLALFRQRLSIFALMAICWFTEVLSLKIPPEDAWIFTDILNLLQGVIVFIIFMVSKQKRKVVKDSFKRKFQRLKALIIKDSSGGEEHKENPVQAKISASSRTTSDGSEGSSTMEGTPSNGQVNGVQEKNVVDHPMAYDNKGLEVEEEPQSTTNKGLEVEEEPKSKTNEELEVEEEPQSTTNKGLEVEEEPQSKTNEADTAV